jgi:hypothetical protein
MSLAAKFRNFVAATAFVAAGGLATQSSVVQARQPWTAFVVHGRGWQGAGEDRSERT